MFSVESVGDFKSLCGDTKRFMAEGRFIALQWAKCRDGTDGGGLRGAWKLAYKAQHRLLPSGTRRMRVCTLQGVFQVYVNS